jgi:hypothetical protein
MSELQRGRMHTKEYLMTIRIGINGFGRIGRLVLRGITELHRNDHTVVAINDLGPPETNAHLLRHDTVHGPFPGEAKVVDGTIDVGNGPIKVLSAKDPGKLHKREQAAKHLNAGARRVLVDAPAEGADLTVVYGVNHEALKTGCRARPGHWHRIRVNYHCPCVYRRSASSGRPPQGPSPSPCRGGFNDSDDHWRRACSGRSVASSQGALGRYGLARSRTL